MNGGQIPPSVPPEFANAGFTLLHLWFLYILCWLYAGVLLLRWAVYTVDRDRVSAKWVDRGIRWTWASPLKSLLLAVPIVAALVLQPAWASWFGIPTPGYTLIPPVLPLFIYGYLFGLGWTLGRQPSLLQKLGSHWLMRLLTRLVAALACLVMAGPEANVATIDDALLKLTYAVIYGVAMISLVLALLGLGVRFLAHASPVVRYVSDASYWMYIAHLPLVMAMQVLLMPFEVHWALKFTTVVVVTCTALLVTYGWCVRSSWIGLMLNGKRHPDRLSLTKITAVAPD